MSLDLSATATNRLPTLGSTTYIKLIRITGATSDPVLGTDTGGTTTSTDLIGAVIKIPQKMIDGERILVSDKMIFIDKTVTPLSSDEIQFDSVNYRIISIDGFNHAGTQQFWKLVIRG